MKIFLKLLLKHKKNKNYLEEEFYQRQQIHKFKAQIQLKPKLRLSPNKNYLEEEFYQRQQIHKF